jgi:hypothetical protein
MPMPSLPGLNRPPALTIDPQIALLLRLPDESAVVDDDEAVADADARWGSRLMRHLLLKGEAPCIMNYCIDNPGGVKQSDQVGRTQHAEGDDEQEKVMDATRNRRLPVPAAGSTFGLRRKLRAESNSGRPHFAKASMSVWSGTGPETADQALDVQDVVQGDPGGPGCRWSSRSRLPV